MPLCTDTMLSFYLWAISHGEWAVVCCDVCCSFVCYCSDRRHAKSHLWWPGVAVSNPGMVCSLQKLSSLIWAILAASTAIKKCGLRRDRQNLCAFEVPKSSLCYELQTCALARLQRGGRCLYSLYWGSSGDYPPFSICMIGLYLLMSPRLNLLGFPTKKDAQWGNLQVSKLF